MSVRDGSVPFHPTTTECLTFFQPNPQHTRQSYTQRQRTAGVGEAVRDPGGPELPLPARHLLQVRVDDVEKLLFLFVSFPPRRRPVGRSIAFAFCCCGAGCARAPRSFGWTVGPSPPLCCLSSDPHRSLAQPQSINQPPPPQPPRYCDLYGGKCSWDARISKYEPNWTGLGENIAMTTDQAQRDPIAAVVSHHHIWKTCVLGSPLH